MDNTMLVCSRIRPASTLRGRVVETDRGGLQGGDAPWRMPTDINLDYPITVDGDASTADAARDMSQLGIHALLVTRRGLPGMDSQVVGLITSRDIARAHGYPDAIPRRPACAARRVRDVMTPWDELCCANFESLRDRCARDLHDMFQGTGLSHLLVVRLRPDDVAVVVGVLSRASLASRLRRLR